MFRLMLAIGAIVALAVTIEVAVEADRTTGIRFEDITPRSGIDFVTDRDRKSTRLNSSHGYISYAVFCLKKKKQHPKHAPTWRPRHHYTLPSPLSVTSH